MDQLLPRCHTEFTSPEYWENFFKKRGSKAFEWYGEYCNLCGLLHKYIKPADKILMVGCGNSRLSEDMYDVGYHSITNIDISEVVIRQMAERNAKLRQDMTFERVDVTKMSYEDGCFSAAVDKGTLDALAVDQEKTTLDTVMAMFEQISRVLRFGGRYIIISLLQDQVISVLIKHFSHSCWPVRVHRIDMQNPESMEEGLSGFCLPVFAVVITKFKDMPNMKQIVEVCSGDGLRLCLESLEQLAATIKEMQYYSLIRQQLSTQQVKEEQLQIQLFSHVATAARYTLCVVDSGKRSSKKFAIFIIPQGRETEWLFSTEAGRRTLSESAGFERLVVVALSRDHQYDNMEAIKAELSTKVMELAPPNHKAGVQVPFLSIGEDLGHRTVRQRGTSQLSGDYVVEDSEGEGGQMFRRLIFLTNQNIVQSEVRLIPVPSAGGKKKKKKGGKPREKNMQVDQSYLACRHHHAMVAGLAFLSASQPTAVLVGLGGGPLASFLHQHFPQLLLEVVEIDKEIPIIAKDWFGFTPSSNVSVHIADGLDFISQLAEKGEKRHLVMLDVDSKDTSLGLSCPPPAFLSEECLAKTSAVLTDDGVYVLNFVCRDQSLRQTITQRLSSTFRFVASVDIPQEVNKVIFASKSVALTSSECPETSDGVGESSAVGNATLCASAVERLNRCAQRLDKEIRAVSAKADIEITQCLADMKLLSLK